MNHFNHADWEYHDLLRGGAQAGALPEEEGGSMNPDVAELRPGDVLDVGRRGVPLRRLRHRPGRPAHQRRLHHDPPGGAAHVGEATTTCAPASTAR